MSKKQNDRATHVDVIEVHEALKPLIEIIETGPDGKGILCRYKGDDDDHTVAERLKVSPATVMSIRRQRYGNLRITVSIPADDNAEISALKASVEQLRGEMAKLRSELKNENAMLWLRSDLTVETYNHTIDNLKMSRALPGGGTFKIKRRQDANLFPAHAAE